MSDTILAAIIGVGGALVSAGLASFGTVHLTNKKENVAIKNTKVYFYDLLNMGYKVQLLSLLEECDNISKDLKKSTTFKTDINHFKTFNTDLIEFFNRDYLYKICNENGISIDRLYVLNDLIKHIIQYNPRTILEYRIQQREDANRRYLNDKSLIKDGDYSAYYRDELNKKYIDNLLIINNDCCNKLDICKTYINLLLEEIDFFLEKLK